MKKLQERLIDAMAVQDFDLNPQQERYRAQQDTKDRPESSLFSFYDDQGTDRRNILYKKENFDEMNSYVQDIKVQLQAVGEAMEEFDAVTAEQWR